MDGHHSQKSYIGIKESRRDICSKGNVISIIYEMVKCMLLQNTDPLYRQTKNDDEIDYIHLIRPQMYLM